MELSPSPTTVTRVVFFNLWGGVRPSPLGTSATTGPTNMNLGMLNWQPYTGHHPLSRSGYKRKGLENLF
jgi:hypothetical protein